MENWIDISEPIETINRWKIECFDLFAHFTEREVQKYLPSFPYWLANIIGWRLACHSTIQIIL